MRFTLVLFALSFFATVWGYTGPQGSSQTLAQYVAYVDPEYGYTYSGAPFVTTSTYTAYKIHVTSQVWFDSSVVTPAEWTHWVTICVPKTLLTSKTVLFSAEYSTSSSEPSAASTICKAATSVFSIGVSVYGIPNQPLCMAGACGLYEDDILAKGTQMFYRTNTTQWEAFFPMVKGMVRVMDAVQNFVQTHLTTIQPIEKFVVTGGSKRGIATWLTAAVDSRVSAIIPISAPTVNFTQTLNRISAAFGTWPPAFDAFVAAGDMNWVYAPGYLNRATIEPATYNSVLPYSTIPKFIADGTDDEYFILDSPRAFMKYLKGSNNLLSIWPNADHSFSGSALTALSPSVLSFYYSVFSGTPLPTYSYTLTYATTGTATVTLTTSSTPYKVLLWTSNTITTAARDFRYSTWTSTPLTLVSGKYTATQAAPPTGWVGFFIQVYFTAQFAASTEVNIVPDTLPFSPCVCAGNTTTTTSTTKAATTTTTSTTKAPTTTTTSTTKAPTTTTTSTTKTPTTTTSTTTSTTKAPTTTTTSTTKAPTTTTTSTTKAPTTTTTSTTKAPTTTTTSTTKAPTTTTTSTTKAPTTTTTSTTKAPTTTTTSTTKAPTTTTTSTTTGASTTGGSSVYEGCYPVAGFTAPYAGHFTSNTVESCIAACDALSAPYAAMIAGTECYCPSFVPDPSVRVDDSHCYTKCPGNANEFCGGGVSYGSLWSV